MNKIETPKAIDLVNKHQTVVETQQETSTRLATERTVLENLLKEKQEEIANTIWENLIDVEGLGRSTKVGVTILLKRPIVEISNWNFNARYTKGELQAHYTKGEMEIHTTDGKMAKVNLSTLNELHSIIEEALKAEGLI